MDGESVQVKNKKAPDKQAPTDKQTNRLSVLVLMGGPSGEREVSLESGKAVLSALAEQGFKVIQGDVGPDDLGVLENGDFDVIFPVLHGTFGEDGELQKILEKKNLCFAGSDSESSRLAMDKHRSKQAFVQGGLLTPEYVFIEDQAGKVGEIAFDLVIERALEKVGVPCVIKPNEQGSSLGIVIAQNEKEAWEAIEQVLTDQGDCLIERFVGGRELTVGILGDQVLEVLEIRPAQGFYDYRAKYLDDNTQYLFDIDLNGEVLEQCRKHSWRAFETLGCRDFGRVDMIVDHWGRIFILEINTIPGFTTHSLLPKAAGQSGISMPKMCAQIVQMAAARTI